MNYTVEVTVRVLGPDGLPIDDRGRPCDEEDNMVQCSVQMSHPCKGFDSACQAMDEMLEAVNKLM